MERTKIHKPGYELHLPCYLINTCIMKQLLFFQMGNWDAARDGNLSFGINGAENAVGSCTRKYACHPLSGNGNIHFI